MSRNVRVEPGRHPRTDAPGVWLRTPYDADFVAAIKQVPAGQRAWDPEECTWFVTESHAAKMVDVVVFYFGETVVVDEAGNEEYRTADGVSARQERLL